MIYTDSDIEAARIIKKILVEQLFSLNEAGAVLLSVHIVDELKNKFFVLEQWEDQRKKNK